MVHHVKRWFRAGLFVAAWLAADAASAKTIHGTVNINLPGVDGMGVLNLKDLGAPVAIKFSANLKTGKFTAHGKGQVTNNFGMPKTFTNQLDLGFMDFNLMNLQTTYTVKANGHCTVTATGIALPPCVVPADSDDECVDECVDGGAGPTGKRHLNAIDAGRRAIPSVQACLAQQRRVD